MSFAVGSSSYYRAPVAAGGPVPTAPVAAPYAPPAAPVPEPYTGGGNFSANGIMDVLKGIFNGIVNFFKGIWSKFFGGKAPAEPLEADSAAIARTYNLLPTKENVQAFLLEARKYEQDGTLGPGSPDSNAIAQVQGALAKWGFQVQPSGKFDQATAAAIIQFKLRNGLHQSYRAADGAWAVNEYLDNQTLTKMRELLANGGQMPASPAPGPAPSPAPAPAPAPAPQPAPGTVNWQAVAQQYGLLPMQDNVQAFLAEVGTYNAGGALGPGMAPERAEDIKELQRLLATRFGYTSVPQNGVWDQATGLAVIDFKRKNGLHQNYKAADGNWAINEYADLNTLRLMMQQAGMK